MTPVEDLPADEGVGIHPDELQQHLHRVQMVLAHSHALEETIGADGLDSEAPALVLPTPEHAAELQAQLDALHPADIAYILEALPLEERRYVWNLVKAGRDGEILLEVSDAVRESLIEIMAPHELKAAAETLDADELADLAPDLPPEVIEDVFKALSGDEREQLRAAMSYDEG